MKKIYYFDHAATTPLAPEALEAMEPYLHEDYGNASALYDLGLRARRGIEAARKSCASLIGATPAEIIFTSGGSESDNWVLRGAVELYEMTRAEDVMADHLDRSGEIEEGGKCKAASAAGGHAHIITTEIEHHAILNTCKYLEKHGVEITYLPVDARGFVSPDAVEKAIRANTCLISVMTANNEIGTIEPIEAIGEIARAHHILFHTDAVQAYGHIPIDVEKLHIDLLSASSHKLNGPKGIGLLYIRRGIHFPSMIFGGEQEGGHRAGTENAAAIVGFGKAAEIATATMPARITEETTRRDHMISRILKEIPLATLNGDPETRLPNNINITIPYVDSEQLLYLLNGRSICASAGSACASGSIDPSHVLTAIGLTHEDAFSSIRFTIGHETTEEDIDYVVNSLKDIVDTLRSQSVLYKEATSRRKP